MSIRVFIYGSCVSRDIFNFDGNKRFELVDYYARSSLATLSGAPYCNDDALSEISSTFQRRMVSRDFSREILDDSRLDQADIILLDLIDERFDLVLLPSSHMVTASAEFLGTGFMRSNSSPFHLIRPGSVERRDLWLKGVELLFHRLQERDLLSRVIVNKIFWATKFESGAKAEFPTSLNSVSSANRELSWMYQVLCRYLNEHQFLEFDDETFLADSQHRWGPSPFHYIDDYYRTALTKLEIKELPRGMIETTATAVSSSLQPPPVFRAETRWGRLVIEWPSLDAFLATTEVKSGIHSVPIGEFAGKQINYDFLLTARSGTVLFCHFHGNAPRDGIDLPIFTGFGVTSSIAASMFIPSDPVLALDASLTLSWHFGCEGIRLQAITVSVVKKLQAILLAPRVVTWGGSGGGFAAIRVAKDIPKSIALAWNPQTNIAKYVKVFVDRYMGLAFPTVATNGDFPSDKEQFSSLCTDEFLDNYQGRILYLQESTDWHVSRHLEPFLESFCGKALSDITDSTDFSGFVTDQLYLHLDHWGNGHVPPSKDFLAMVLGLLSDVTTNLETLENLTGFMKLKEILAIRMDRIADDFSPYDSTVNCSGDTVDLPLFTGEIMQVSLAHGVQWHEKFATQANSSVMWLFSLAPIGRLLSTFQKTNDEKTFWTAFVALESFLIYSSEPVNQLSIGRIPSADHSAATRVRVLIKFIQVMRERPNVDYLFLARVCDCLKYWSDWLSEAGNYKKNNHGLMGSIALLHSAIQFGAAPYAGIYLDMATNRIIELGKSSFDRDGLCNENSIGYHNFNLHCYRGLLEFCKHYGLSETLVNFLEDLILRAKQALEFCVWQDGSIPPIGDSPVYRINIPSKNEPRCFYESGFAVVKNDDLYLSILCGAPTEIHKQVDDSSITLRFMNREILVDGGSYLYDRTDPHRRCVESSFGHSGLFLKEFDGLLRSEFLRKFGPVTGKIDRFEESDDGVRVKCVYSVSNGRVVFVRNIFVCWPDEVAIVDSVELSEVAFSPETVQRFLFGPTLDVQLEECNKLILAADEFSGSLFQLVDCDGVLYRGEDSALVRGWCSYKYKEILPTYGVDFVLNTHISRFSTVIKLTKCASLSECSKTVRKFANGTDPFFN